VRVGENGFHARRRKHIFRPDTREFQNLRRAIATSTEDYFALGINRVDGVVDAESHASGDGNFATRIEQNSVDKSAGEDFEVGAVCCRLEVGGSSVATRVGVGIHIGKDVVTSQCQSILGVRRDTQTQSIVGAWPGFIKRRERTLVRKAVVDLSVETMKSRLHIRHIKIGCHRCTRRSEFLGLEVVRCDCFPRPAFVPERAPVVEVLL
jgi:hypothetical protein